MCTTGDMAQCVKSNPCFPKTCHRLQVSYIVAMYSFLRRYVFGYLVDERHNVRDTACALFCSAQDWILTMYLK